MYNVQRTEITVTTIIQYCLNNYQSAFLNTALTNKKILHWKNVWKKLSDDVSAQLEHWIWEHSEITFTISEEGLRDSMFCWN